ncbi:hypothetical protein COCON_G00235640, partial [Conger conger]
MRQWQFQYNFCLQDIGLTVSQVEYQDLVFNLLFQANCTAAFIRNKYFDRPVDIFNSDSNALLCLCLVTCAWMVLIEEVCGVKTSIHIVSASVFSLHCHAS